MAFSIISACSNSPLPAIDMSKAILLTRFSMLLVLVSVSKLFYLICVWMILVAEWPPLGKELPIRLILCSLSIHVIVYLYFWLFPILVSRERLWFLMHQFLVIVFIFTFLQSCDQLNATFYCLFVCLFVCCWWFSFTPRPIGTRILW